MTPFARGIAYPQRRLDPPAVLAVTENVTGAGGSERADERTRRRRLPRLSQWRRPSLSQSPPPFYAFASARSLQRLSILSPSGI